LQDHPSIIFDNLFLQQYLDPDKVTGLRPISCHRQTEMTIVCTSKPAVSTARPHAKRSSAVSPYVDLAARTSRGTAGLLAAVAVLSVSPTDLQAAGIERMDMPVPSGITSEGRNRNQAVIDSAEDAFQNSELLRSLKEKSELNKDQRKRDLLDLYCRRQAELGVGDCAGLRLIPGATKSGVQKRPEWLDNLAKSVLGDGAVEEGGADVE
jgi:hypothetical protein